MIEHENNVEIQKIGAAVLADLSSNGKLLLIVLFLDEIQINSIFSQ